MGKALIRTLAASALLGLATAAAAQPFTVVDPNGARGYTETTPGAAHPFTLLNPNGPGGYTAITPRASQPTFMNPKGYTLLTPGQSFAPAVPPSRPAPTQSYGGDDN
jgi:hypothetical protein